MGEEDWAGFWVQSSGFGRAGPLASWVPSIEIRSLKVGVGVGWGRMVGGRTGRGPGFRAAVLEKWGV